MAAQLTHHWRTPLVQAQQFDERYRGSLLKPVPSSQLEAQGQGEQRRQEEHLLAPATKEALEAGASKEGGHSYKEVLEAGAEREGGQSSKAAARGGGGQDLEGRAQAGGYPTGEQRGLRH